MKFLADQDVYSVTIDFLKALGHDIVRASEINLAQASDLAILDAAHAGGRILITRDRDFGAVVFLQRKGPGVMYLRILPAAKSAVHEEFARVLTMYSEHILMESFIVIEPGRHRIRTLGGKPL